MLEKAKRTSQVPHAATLASFVLVGQRIDKFGGRPPQPTLYPSILPRLCL
jgi:hypothetical protein